jgi:hypothetical protein
MVLTREVETPVGAARLLRQASKEIAEAAHRFYAKYHKQIRFLAILADCISARVYNDTEEAWRQHVRAMREEQDRRDEND